MEDEPESITAFRRALAAEFPDRVVETVFQRALQLPLGPLTRTLVVFGDHIRVVTVTHSFVSKVLPDDRRFQEAVVRVADAMRGSLRPSLYLILDWEDGRISLRGE